MLKRRKAPKRPARNRRRPNEKVTASCLSCAWTSTGTTWRPVKRALAAHKQESHADLAPTAVVG